MFLLFLEMRMLRMNIEQNKQAIIRDAHRVLKLNFL